MNKYKMISMCSLTIVFVLIMSLVLPMTITANEKESLKMKWKYEDSTVTVNIIVNSDVYTGVVCKYMEIDNVLLYDGDLMEDVKENGKTLNVNAIGEDNYEVTINDITSRYVVVYTTIGNCELCDYIDCMPTDEEKPEEKQEESKETEQPEIKEEVVVEEIKEENKEQPTENIEKEEKVEEQKEGNKEEIKEENKEISNISDDDFQEIEEVKKEEKTENKEEQKEEKTNVIAEIIKKTEELIEKENIRGEEVPANNENEVQEVSEENKSEEKNVQDLQDQNTENKEKEDTPKPIKVEEFIKENTAESTVKSEESKEPEASKQNVVKEINDEGFEEIKSIDKVSTADSTMPQTGEDDGFKIFGIVVFSIIAAVSFYKYKTTK